jgi:hypothetical protein
VEVGEGEVNGHGGEKVRVEWAAALDFFIGRNGKEGTQPEPGQVKNRE